MQISYRAVLRLNDQKVAYAQIDKRLGTTEKPVSRIASKQGLGGWLGEFQMGTVHGQAAEGHAQSESFF